MKKYLFLLLVVLLIASCTGEKKESVASTKVTYGDTSQKAVVGSDLRITTTGLSEWVSGLAGTFPLQATGGTPPYVWGASGLPQGIQINQQGVIAGIIILPSGSSKINTPEFEVSVIDSKGNKATTKISITVTEGTLKIIPAGSVTCPELECDAVIATAEGGSPPYSFTSDSFAEGAPPMGMTVDINGKLKGKTKKARDYVVGICVKDTVAASKCTKVNVKVEEKESTLTGTWQGSYSETATDAYCGFREVGQKTFKITEKDGSISGSAEYSGTSSVIRGENCEGSQNSGSGTISGKISANQVTGTIMYEGSVPFTATLSGDGNTLSGTYSYSTNDYGVTLTGAGEFVLKKK